MNKSILFIIFLVCCSANLIYSQAPEGINFQAVARDGNGNVASERTIYVQVDLKVDRDSNNAVYSESFNVVSSKEGIFSVIIGNGSRLSGVDNIIDLDWGSVIYYLNLNVAVSPSLYDPEWNYIDEYVDLGTSQIWSVPYAFAANTAKTIDGILSSDQGGTGVNNNGKTISLEGNLSLLGENNLTINTTADSNITLPISGTLATVSDVENRIVDVNITTSSIQSELDATQTGAGLGIDGTYTADSSTNYISAATSLTAADTALDTQISANTTNIATNANTINANASTATNLQSELDATQTGAGLGIDGTYTADSSTNYISVATSLTAADTALDTQISANTTNIATNANTINANASTATNLQSELDATQTGAGLGIDGTYTADSSTNYISVATSLTAADTALDTQINSNATEIQQLNNQKLNLSGGVMTGTLDMGNNTITNLKNPINNQDVVNKQYVDTAVTQIDITKLQIGLEEGKIFVGDSSDLAKAVNATGDISIANSGVVSIADNAVSSAKILDGTITSTDIANESILDQSLATISTAGKVANTATTANENNVANTIVLRDSNGDFSAETITADVLGNASTASKLQSPVTIAGQSFDGSTNIQIAPNDLAGVTADANEINVLDGITPSTVELNYVDGTTSNIQNQLNAKATNSDLISIENRVASNELSIATNLTNISTNTDDISAMDTKVTTNTNDIAGLDTRVTSNTNNIATNSSDIATNLTNISTNTDDISAMDTKVTANTNDIAGLDTRVTSNTNNIATNSSNIATNLTNISTNTDDISAMDTKVTANTNDIAGLDTRVTSNTNNIATNSSNIATNLTNISTNTDDISAMDTKVTANTNDIAGLDTRVTSNTNNIATNSSDIATNLTSISTNTDDISAMDTKVTTNTNDIAGLDTRVTSNTNNIATNSSDIATNLTNISTNTDDISAMDTKVTANTNDIAGLDTRVTSNTNNIATNSSNIATNLTNISTNTDDISAMDTKVTANTNDIAGLDTRVTSNTNNIATNSSNIATNLTNISTNTDDISAMDTKVTANTNDIAGLDTRVTSNTNNIATNSSDIATNLTSISTNTDDISAMDTKVTTNTNDIAGLDTRVTSNTNNIATNSSDIATNLTNISTNTDDISAMDTKVTANTNDIAGLDTRVTSNTNNIATNSSNIATNLTNISTNTDDISAMDTKVTANTNDIAGLDTRVTSNTNNIATNSSDIATNLTNISTNTDDISAMDTKVTANTNDIAGLDTRVTSNTNNIATNSSDIATNLTNISTNTDDISALQTEVNTTQTGAGLGVDGTYTADTTTNYITAATSLNTADVALDTQLKTVSDQVTSLSNSSSDTSADISALQTEVNTTQTGAGLGVDGTYTADTTTNYITAATSLNTADVALDTQLKTVSDQVTSLSNSSSDTSADISALQTEVNTTQTGAGLGVDGTYTADTTTNYITAATSLNTADVALDTQLKTVSDQVTSLSNSSSDTSADISALQTEVNTTQTGAGLGVDGTYTADTTTNYITAATSLNTADVALDTQLKTVSDQVTSLSNSSSDTSADISALQTEVNTTQTGAGLGTDGSYTANATTNYLSTSTSLVDATEDLDSQIKTNTDAITANAGSNTNLQTELDTTQTGAGLGTDGSYTADMSSNYIYSATSLTEADTVLDTQINTNATNIAANTSTISTNATNVTGLQSEIDATQTGAGLGSDGSYTADMSSNYIYSATSLTEADTVLDTQLKSVADEVASLSTSSSSGSASIQSELDATQTGAGLGTDGSYTANATTNYLSTSTSLVGATEDLDSQVKTNADAITANAGSNTNLQTELDTTQTGAGLGSDGSYTADMSSNYIYSATSLTEADTVLDTQINTNATNIAANTSTISTNATNVTGLQSEIDATQTGAGLGSDGSYTADMSSNYIYSATSLTEADTVLDTQINTNATNIAANTSTISTNATNVTGLQSEIDATQTGAGLGSDGSYTANATTNYLSTSTSLVGATEDLDSQVKTNADAITANAGSNTNLQTELDTTQTGAGLGSDGSYTADMSSNYIYSATSLTEADTVLDTQINTNATNIAANTSTISTNATNVTGLQSELDATQTGAGLGSDGSYTADMSSNYIYSATSLTEADTVLDTQINTNATNIAANTSTISTNATNVTGLQSEIDATQTGAGLGTDGAYTANAITNYLSTSTSLIDATEDLDSQIKTNADAITANAGSNTSLQSELDATQTGAGLGTDGAYTANAITNYLSASTSLVGATEDLDSQIKTNADAITANAGSNTSLQSELDATQTGAGLGSDGSYTADMSSNYIYSATSLTEADTVLDTQLKSVADEVASLSTSSSSGSASIQSELDATQTGAGLGSDGSYTADMSSNYIYSATSLTEADTVLDTQLKSVADEVASLSTSSSSGSASIQSELDATQTGAGLGTDGSYTANATTNYLSTSTSLVDATEDLDSQIKTNTGAITANAGSNTNLQTELDTTQTGAGLGTDGSYTADMSSNYIYSATSLTEADTVLDTQINTNATNIAANTSTISTIATNVTGLQSELDATQTGAGLGSDGSYTADMSSNYIYSATSLTEADTVLDTQLKSVADEVASLSTSSSSGSASIQSELDATQTGAGLGTDGSYTANATTNYLSTSTSLVDATEDLDSQIKTNTGAITANAGSNTNLQTELDTTQTGAGLGTDGSYTADMSSNYIYSATSLTEADTVLDTQINTNATNIAANTSTISTNATNVTGLQSEIDATQTGAGLGSDGSYTADMSSNYIYSATSLTEADTVLDTQINTNATNIAANTSTISTNATNVTGLQSEVDATQTGAGLGSDGSYTADMSSNYIYSATSLTEADTVLDTQINTNATNIAANTSTISTNATNVTGLQSEIDATQTGAGLGSDGSYTADMSSNYIYSATSLTEADTVLDTQINTNATNIAANTSTISTNATNVTGLQSEIDATQTGAGLGSDGSYTADMSSNYIYSATSLTEADTVLDTQINTNATNIAANTSTISTNATNVTGLQSEIDATQTGAGLGSDGSYTADMSSNYIYSATSLTEADTVLDTQINTNATNIAANTSTISTNATNVTGLQSEIDATQTGAGLGSDGSYTADMSSNYIYSATSLTEADTVLDTQINTNATNIAANTSTISTNATNVTGLQSEIDATQTGAGLGSDGSYTADMSSNYIYSATSLTEADTVLDTQINTNATNIAANTSTISTNATNVTGLQSEIDATQTGAGLGSDGSYTADMSSNYIYSATSLTEADTVLDTQINTNATNIAANTSTISTNATNVTGLQSEIDATQTGAGLGSDGSYTADMSSNYIYSATSLTEADTVLDTQINTNATNIAANTSTISTNATNVTGLQSEIDATQTGAGLGSDGSYTADMSSNYIYSATSLTEADTVLDTQINTNATNIAANTSTISTNATNVTGLQSEIDATQTGAGLGSDGSYTADMSSNYIYSATSLTEADTVLDTQINTNATNIAANTSTISTNATNVTGLQSEIDATQTGAGLGSDGSYTADMSSNYIYSATSLTEADTVLDTQINTNATNIAANTSTISTNATNVTGLQSEIDATQTGAGLGSDGSYTADMSSNYIYSATSLTEADTVLDTQINTNATNIAANTSTISTNATNVTGLQSEIDATQTGAGLGSDGSYTADMSSNYIYSATSLTEADTVLDTQINTNATNIAANTSTISTNATNVTGLQSEIDATQTGAGLGSDGSYTADMSSNYIYSATSLTEADTVLDTQINTNATNIAANTSTISTNATNVTGLQSEIDATQTGAGLGTDGAYTANAITNYLSTSTSLIDATEDLDSQIKTNADAITANAGSNTNLQTELDATQTGAGLGTDGAYTANAITNYLSASTSLIDATEDLDSQIKTNADAITANAGSNTSLQSELDATQTGAGLGTDGAYTANAITNYLSASTSLVGATEDLDSQIKTNADQITSLSTSSSNSSASLQSELDATQTGAGLGADGTYTANSSANYIASVTSLLAADAALDAQIKINTDALSSVSGSDATTTTKGILKLAGDLGGTADLPTVPGLTNKEDSTNKSTTTSLGTSDVLFPTQNAVKTYVDNQIASGSVADATTSVKGILKLAGDFGGTADLPTVPSLGLKENLSHKSTSAALGNSDVLYPTQNAVKTYVDAQVTVIDATNSIKGKIKLAGDLGGTADLPTVPGLSNKEDSSNKSTAASLGTSDILFPTQNAVKTYVDTQIATGSVADATTSVKGVLKLAGDLGGTAELPTVPDLILKENASLKSSDVNLGSSNVLYPTQGAVKTYVDSQISSLSSASDASSTVKGILKLTGDLGGTADSPTVPGLSNKEDTSNKSTTSTLGTSDVLFPTQNAVKTYVDTQITSSLSLDATSTVKGILKLTGDLSGTADTPTVPGLLLKAPINNPSLTGVPTAPTASSGTNTTQIATTAFVADAVTGVAASGVFVDLTSDQTVGGEKTFTSDLTVSSTLSAGGTAFPSSTGTTGQVLMISSSGVAQWTTIIQEVNVEVTATASQTSFTLSQAPSDRSIIKMYINGVRVSNSAYSLNSLTVTYNPTNNGSYSIMSGDRIQFDYYY